MSPGDTGVCLVLVLWSPDVLMGQGNVGDGKLVEIFTFIMYQGPETTQIYLINPFLFVDMFPVTI